MIHEYGTPTLFLMFSCAEYKSAEYKSADSTDDLRKVNNVPSSYKLGKLCIKDPLSVLRKFSLKFHAFFAVICKRNVLSEVEYFISTGIGAPHYYVYVMLWIHDTPVNG